MVVFLVCLIPTLYEAWSDRKGEDRKGKRKDSVWLIVAAIIIVGASWWVFDYNPLAVSLLLLSIRIAFFDYLVHYFLKKHSEGHKFINIWKFVGDTAVTDRLTAKVDYRLRIAIRLVVFAASLYFFLTFH